MYFHIKIFALTTYYTLKAWRRLTGDKATFFITHDLGPQGKVYYVS